MYTSHPLLTARQWYGDDAVSTAPVGTGEARERSCTASEIPIHSPFTVLARQPKPDTKSYWLFYSPFGQQSIAPPVGTIWPDKVRQFLSRKYQSHSHPLIVDEAAQYDDTNQEEPPSNDTGTSTRDQD